MPRVNTSLTKTLDPTHRNVMLSVSDQLPPVELRQRYRDNWNKFAREVLRVRLDRQQKECLELVQVEKRVSIRSGNARGKDYLAAVASLCFLLLNRPSKVINTAPSGRQVTSIMMAEISKIYGNAAMDLGGEVQTNLIKFPGEPDWFLLGFKAGDKKHEVWQGFHSPNVMVVITEASGVDDFVFEGLESILQGNAKLLLIYNPTRLSGEAYRSIASPAYKSVRLSCLNAPNVKAKKIIIPGQVDYAWIKYLIEEKHWAREIDEGEFDETRNTFYFAGKPYTPNDLFRVKVLGQPPLESSDVLIPYAWCAASIERHHSITEAGDTEPADPLTIGVDVAGEGRDNTVFCHRYNGFVRELEVFSRSDHMQTVGRLVERLDGEDARAMVDTIGEGAGVHSRAVELHLPSQSAKFSESAKGLTDYSGHRTFANMRAYCYWAIRDALNPEYETNLAIPDDDELIEELHEIHWEVKSNGDIAIEPKDKIKERLGRSPDKADSLALSYFPRRHGPRMRLI